MKYEPLAKGLGTIVQGVFSQVVSRDGVLKKEEQDLSKRHEGQSKQV